jgi:hypothetical protein
LARRAQPISTGGAGPAHLADANDQSRGPRLSGDEQAARILRNAQAAHEFASYQGWLKTRMLLFSLVECARIIPNVKTQIAPLWDLVEANQQKSKRSRRCWRRAISNHRCRSVC